MKTWLSVASISLFIMSTAPTAWADVKTEKVMRNDRVIINKPVVEFDINPFVDRQRIMRNDRVNYTVVKNQKQFAKQKRIMRNDRISFYQPAQPVTESVE